MKLTQEQKQALNQLSLAFCTLSDCWSDELGEILNSAGLLPQRDLTEAANELFHSVSNGEITEKH